MPRRPPPLFVPPGAEPPVRAPPAVLDAPLRAAAEALEAFFPLVLVAPAPGVELLDRVDAPVPELADDFEPDPAVALDAPLVAALSCARPVSGRLLPVAAEPVAPALFALDDALAAALFLSAALRPEASEPLPEPAALFVPAGLALVGLFDWPPGDRGLPCDFPLLAPLDGSLLSLLEVVLFPAADFSAAGLSPAEPDGLVDPVLFGSVADAFESGTDAGFSEPEPLVCAVFEAEASDGLFPLDVLFSSALAEDLARSALFLSRLS